MLLKHDISAIPFDKIKNLDTVKDFVSYYKLKNAWSWLADQLYAHLATHKLPSKNQEGQYDGEQYLKMNLTTAWEQGLWRMITKVNRSILVDKQTSPVGLTVCGLIPIYMAAHKKYNGIKYSQWTNIDKMVDNRLFEAMTDSQGMGFVDGSNSLNCYGLGSEELLQLRDLGLNGHSPVTYHTLVGISGTKLKDIPPLARIMLTQIWCAHPINRHELMVLDPHNWDNIPEPLVDVEAMVQLRGTTRNFKETETFDPNVMPWEITK